MQVRGLLPIVFMLICAVQSYAQEETPYPSDAVINVTSNITPYNLDNSGMTDVTDDLNNLIADIYANGGHQVLYFPNGIYKISGEIKWYNVLSWAGGITFTGESRAGTIIKLADNTPVYSDPSDPKNMIYSGRAPGELSNNNNIYSVLSNITLDTGSGNPGAIAINFNANNTGGIKNVTIKSGDGQGAVGLDMGQYDSAGTILISQVLIEGFDLGFNFLNSSIAFEHVTFKDIHDVAIFNSWGEIAARKITTQNVNRVYNSDNGGYFSLLDSNLDGLGGGTAIDIDAYPMSHIFLRNISFSEFSYSVDDKSQRDDKNEIIPNILTSSYISEWSNQLPFTSLGCPSTTKSLNLPVKETPVIAYEPLSEWVGVKDFGADPNDIIVQNNSITADGNQIQAALDDGASTVYFNNSYSFASFPPMGFAPDYILYRQDLNIPAHVKRIVGGHQRIVGNEVLFRIYDNAETITISGGSAGDTLIIEDLLIVADIVIADDRVVIFKNVYCGSGILTSLPNANGDIYIEGCTFGNMFIHNCNVWARSLNMESNRREFGSQVFIINDNLVNDNCKLWVLNNKSEGSDAIFKTINGGQTEIINFVLGSWLPDPTPLFLVEDSDFSLVSLRVIAGNGTTEYSTLIQHVTNGDTLNVDKYDLGFQNHIAQRIYTYFGYIPSGPNEAPAVEPLGDCHSVLVGQDFDIDVPIGDDGLPNGNCDLSVLWNYISGPGIVNANDVNIANPRFNFTLPGTYVLEIQVSDGSLQTNKQITFYVYENCLTTASGNGADSYVFRNQHGPTGASMDDNYGQCENLETDYKVSGGAGKVYLRFDVTGFPLPVENAAIDLTTSSFNYSIPATTFEVYGLSDGHSGENWQEGDECSADATSSAHITYNNAPGNDNSDTVNNDVLASEVTPLGTYTKSTAPFNMVDKFTSMDLVDFINLDTDGLITLIVVPDDASFQNNNSFYASKEHSTLDPPSMYLTYDPNGCIANRYIPGQIGTSVNQASQVISSDATVVNGAVTDYHAGNCVELLPNFETMLGADFIAYILGCVPNLKEEDSTDKKLGGDKRIVVVGK